MPQLVDDETKNTNHHDPRHHQLHIELLLTQNNQRPQSGIDAGHFAGEYRIHAPKKLMRIVVTRAGAAAGTITRNQ